MESLEQRNFNSPSGGECASPAACIKTEQSPPILAFDCATSPASVALRVGERVVVETVPHGQQAAQLVAVIDRLLRENHVHYRDVDSIVTTVGPGSFTGLRIALAALHGLVLACPTPVRLITVTEAVAWAVGLYPDAPRNFIVALDAGKGEVFAQAFTVENTRPMATDSITTHPAAFVAGCAAPCFSNLLPPDHPHYVSGADAVVLARVAEYIPVKPLAEAVPYYIREADAKLPTPASVL